MPDNKQQRLIRDLFDAASDLAEAQRQACVEVRAGCNAEVVASVMRLLRAANASGQGFLAEPAFKRQAPALQEGMMIGPYRVLRELGSGGMGVVYLAMRSDEVYRRLAAVKVIRPELRDNPLKERFLREREILAGLDHPNIARIVDGGNTPDGLPYFVMDYVDGQPLDEYCRNQRATLEQRLSLFLQTCQAVQYLHDNNVLHRDLKPANILVTHTGQVKLLDFGVSKLGFSKTGFDSKVTLGAPVLTAGYASPEQITSKPVTAASDIYSLWRRALRTAHRRAPAQARQQEPASDSGNHHRPGASQAQYAAAAIRGSRSRPSAGVHPPGAWSTGDMDSILLMALRKEPLRRYPSATAFAEDLQRFLERRPVVARGDGAAYVVTKTIRRNRMRIAALILIGISLAGAGFALWRALDYRSQLESLRNDLGQLRNHQEQYRLLPAPEARTLMQHDLDRLSTQISAKTPEILKS